VQLQTWKLHFFLEIYCSWMAVWWNWGSIWVKLSICSAVLMQNHAQLIFQLPLRQ